MSYTVTVISTLSLLFSVLWSNSWLDTKALWRLSTSQMYSVFNSIAAFDTLCLFSDAQMLAWFSLSVLIQWKRVVECDAE